MGKQYSHPEGDSRNEADINLQNKNVNHHPETVFEMV